jgi:hypothetical protein
LEQNRETMKLRGESGGVPSRAGGAGGGSGAKRAFTRKSSSVKVVKGTDGKNNIDKNSTEDIMVQMRKNGDLAKITALRTTGKPKATVKINTNPVKVKAKAKPVKVKPSVKVVGKRVIKIKSNNL